MSEKMINLKINGIAVSVPEGTTILQAAREVGIKIPTLCYLKEINEIGACRVCVVEVKGARTLTASCVYPVAEGMEVTTNSEKVMDARKKTVELLLSDHNKSCLSCARNGQCELAEISTNLGCDAMKYHGEAPMHLTDHSSEWLVRDNTKCVVCKRCVAMCKKIQEVSVIDAMKRGHNTYIGCAFDQDLAEVDCAACGQCINVCPTGALQEKDDLGKIQRALTDPTKHVIVATAPAVRVAIGEEFGYEIGTNQEGKMVTALKYLGFDKVFDIDFSADLTIMEEAYEFINRVKTGGKFPMFTSCSPGWIRYIEYYYPELLDNLSSCKSPQQMFGAVIKTYYAQKNNIDPKDIVMVTVMPCTAKKFEITREDQNASGYPDIDYVMTTRELARFVRRKGIDFRILPDGEFENPFGVGSGAGLIFGVTGGVMEAALRTASEVLTGESLPAEKLDFVDVRGMEGVKEAKYDINGLEVKVAVVSGLTNAKKLCEAVKKGEADYHFVEVMCCPGGCLNGGGQPLVNADTRNFTDYKALRAKALYDTDKSMQLRKSHENPYIKSLYEEFYGEPNSHKAHHDLHTTYVDRKNK
ncbi:MAG: NADH-dependent [FeFe] hydrogenase, group A6 [Bacillota bacterium]